MMNRIMEHAKHEFYLDLLYAWFHHVVDTHAHTQSHITVLRVRLLVWY